MDALDKARERLAEASASHNSLDAFFKQLDVDNNQSIDADELQKGLEQLGASLSFDCVRKLMESVGATGDSARLSFAQFEKIVHQVPSAARETEDWVASLGLQRLLATHLDSAVDSTQPSDKTTMGLASIASMNAEQVEKACAAFCADLKKVLLHNIQQLQIIPASMPPAAAGGQGKFQFTSTDGAKVGDFASTIEFFGGLDGLIGLPNPNVLEAMEGEHLLQDDSHDVFVTHNYGHLETTPAKEWEYVVAPRADVEYEGKFRIQRDISELISHENAQLAGLIKEEVIALRLYTGPMYVKYNAKLRNYPERILDGMKGNGYVTTIHCIVSGVIKLSKVWSLPEGRRVFRGLGGLLLPEAFWKEDGYGCRGGVERGLMSTTTDKEVAMQYSGQDSGRPTIFEINVGQIDRGANLSWLSQYPKEEEVLMPPLSNLEVVGTPRIETSRFGPVMVIPLRVNVNIKSSTIEEVLKRRKELHLSMLQNLVHSARHDLLRSWPAQLHRDGQATLEWSGVMGELSELVADAEGKPGEWYNDDDNLSNAMAAAMAAKKGAKRKFGTLQSKLEAFLPCSQPPTHPPSNNPDPAPDGPTMLPVQPDHLSRGLSLSWNGVQGGGGGAEVHGARRVSIVPPRGATHVPGKEGRQLERVQKTRVQDWAREGFQFMVEAGTDVLPWDAIAEGKLHQIELPAQLPARQAEVAWRCIRHGIETSSDFAKRTVMIRGGKGGVLKVDAKTALDGEEIVLWQDRIDAGGQRVSMPQQPAGDAVCVLLSAIKSNSNLRKLDLGAPDLSSSQAIKVANVLRALTTLEILRVSGDAIDVRKARTEHALDYSIWEEAGPDADQRGDDDQAISSQREESMFAKLGRMAKRVISGESAAEEEDEESAVVNRKLSAKQESRKKHSVIEVFGEEVAADDVYTLQEGICLASFIAANSRNITGHKIGSSGATALASALKESLSLVALNLRGNMIGAMGADQIASVIGPLSKLEVLELRGNNLGVRGPKSLAPVIAPSPVLTTLNGLRIEYITTTLNSKEQSCFVGSAGVSQAFAGSVHGIRVRGVSEPGYEAFYLARRLRECGPVLGNLDLGENGLGLTGAKALSDVLMSLPCLSSLHLADNALRSDGLVTLLPAIEACTSLTVLDLRNNAIDSSGMDAMADAMARGLGRGWKLTSPHGLKWIRLEGNLGWEDRLVGLKLEAKTRPGTKLSFLTWPQFLKVSITALGVLSLPILFFAMIFYGQRLWDTGDQIGAFYLVFSCAFCFFLITLWQLSHEIWSPAIELGAARCLGFAKRQRVFPEDDADDTATGAGDTQGKGKKRPPVAIDMDNVERTGSAASELDHQREMKRERRLLMAMENQKLFLGDSDHQLVAEEDEGDEECEEDPDAVEEFEHGEEDDADGNGGDSAYNDHSARDSLGEDAAVGLVGRKKTSVGFVDEVGSVDPSGSASGEAQDLNETQENEEPVDLSRRGSVRAVSTLGSSIAESPTAQSQSRGLVLPSEDRRHSEARVASVSSGNLTKRSRLFSTPKHAELRGREHSNGVQSDGAPSLSRFGSAMDLRPVVQEVAIDERVLRRVGMLTKQFKEATCTAESLDKRVKEVYKKMQLHSSGIATSKNQLAEMLMLPGVAVLFFVLFVYYTLVAYVLINPWAVGTIDLYSHFRLDTRFANRTLSAASIVEFGVFEGECQFQQVNTTVLGERLYLELEQSIASRRVYAVFDSAAPSDPVSVELFGCSLDSSTLIGPEASTSPTETAPTQTTPESQLGRRSDDTDDEVEVARSAGVWDCPRGWTQLAGAQGVDMSTVGEIELEFEEKTRKTIVRFIPAVLGCMSLSVVYFQLTRRVGKGRRMLILGLTAAAVSHAVAAVMSPTLAESLARLMPAVLMLPMIGTMLKARENFMRHVLIYCFVYVPMVALYLRYLLQDSYELPPLIVFNNRLSNYDQYNVFPLLALLVVVSLFLRFRRAWMLYWTVRSVWQDVSELELEWHKLCSATNSAEITDVSTEVDRMRAQIKEPAQQLQPSGAHSSDYAEEREDWSRAMLKETYLQALWRGQGGVSRRRRGLEVTSMQQLFAQAAGLTSILREKLVAWACASDGKFVAADEDTEAYIRGVDVMRRGEGAVRWSELKGKVRTVEKCYLAYGGDVSRLMDLCRETMVFDRLEQIANCLAVIRQDRNVEVVRVCNRLNPGGRHSLVALLAGSISWEKNDGPMISGYRDVSINLMIQTAETRALGLDRHVVELRLVPRGIHELTLGYQGQVRHKRYQNLRNALTV